jgi:hypothetical protein
MRSLMRLWMLAAGQSGRSAWIALAMRSISFSFISPSPIRCGGSRVYCLDDLDLGDLDF